MIGSKSLKIKSHKILLYKMIGVLLAAIMMILFNPMMAEAAAKTYKVKATDQPYKGSYIKSEAYNEKTRQYFMLRSYLEQLEKDGGGTLILTKGTYSITNTLNVPSGVTIILKNGVKLVKGTDTGTTKLTPAKSMFQLITPSKAAKPGIMTKYNGEKGITIRGEGNATVDLNYMKDSVGIVLGHNKDVRIEGITFQKMYGGSFIRIAASEKVIIADNTFRNHKNSKDRNSYAIAIETPDNETKSFSYPWSKNDKTVSRSITIEGNTFKKLERGVGSLKYTDKKYHKNINILKNSFTDLTSHGVRILNWEDCVIRENSFINLKDKNGGLQAVMVSGAKNPTITENEFLNSDRAIQLMPWRNTNNGSKYAITYNELSEQNISDIKTNTLKEMKEFIIRNNNTYQEFKLDTDKWQIYDEEVTDFTVNMYSEPFQNAYINYSTYNDKTMQYYVIRSYLEQLERVGGGTLTLEAGTYRICNALYIPSGVTIKLKNGVTILKTEETGVDNMDSSRSIFQLVAPSKAKIEGAYGGYDGETNIRIQGEGTATIDLNFVQDSIGIVLCHNTNVSISGITFKKMYSGHFIELDASSEVTIENNKFLNHKPSETGKKEAINLDTPDKHTKGFTSIWTKFDGTPNKNIIISNNDFDNLERAIGTHKYTQDKYHHNVQILNNRISNTSSDAIRLLNWTSPVIKGNEISMVAGGKGTDRAILASGIKNPVITGNTFIDVPRPIQLMPQKNEGPGDIYEATYNVLTPEDMELMLQNKLVRCGEIFIRVNKSTGIYEDPDVYQYMYDNITW